MLFRSHHLVASFKGTLEEITYADLVLHIVDRSHPRWREQQEVGCQVLQELGVDPERVITVFNKSDEVGETVRRRDGGLWLSALTGEGLDDLKGTILDRLRQLPEVVAGELAVPPERRATL